MKNIALVVYGRFPTERAYGSHIIDTANGFLENGLKVTVLYSKTNNQKSLHINPEEYYKSININFVEVENLDFTKYKLYEFLPKIFQKAFWTIGAYFWSIKLGSYLDGVDTIWSTNPNVLFRYRNKNKTVIYEKHGAGKRFQKYTVKKISKNKNVFFVGTSKTSYKELLALSPDNTIYLTNGVNLNNYNNHKIPKKSNKLNIGYIGMLETYGVDKGVKKAFQELKEISHEFNFKLTLIGGPKNKIDEIVHQFDDSEVELDYKYKIPKNEVPTNIQKLDIGIVPYPDEYHMSNYASPMKIFEYAAGNVVILSSDIKSNLELSETGLGIIYFKAGDFDDFKNKIIDLLKDDTLRSSLINKSEKNIEQFSIKNRIEKLINFCVRSSIG